MGLDKGGVCGWSEDPVTRAGVSPPHCGPGCFSPHPWPTPPNLHSLMVTSSGRHEVMRTVACAQLISLENYGASSPILFFLCHIRCVTAFSGPMPPFTLKSRVEVPWSRRPCSPNVAGWSPGPPSSPKEYLQLKEEIAMPSLLVSPGLLVSTQSVRTLELHCPIQ